MLIPGPEQIHPALGVLDVGESTYQDQGSVNAHVGKPCALAGQYLSFQPGRGRKPASWWEGGPEGLEQKKKIKVDK